MVKDVGRPKRAIEQVSLGYHASLLAACLLALGGCGKTDDRIPVYPVSGKVLVQGRPPVGALVVFYVTDEEARDPNRPIPQGVVQEDGTFQLMSYKEGDGAPAGNYRVTVEWPEPIPEGVNREMYTPRDRLRGRYAAPARSGLQATVVEDVNVLEPFDLQ